jgi:hypothetical protein
VRFVVTIHSGQGAPPDALERLWEGLPKRHEDTRFIQGTSEIKATWGEDAPVSMESDEREEKGRGTVMEVVRETCERSPDLRFAWFAVSARR